MTGPVRVLLSIVCLTLTACATQTVVKEEFDRSAKAYNRMLRWHEMENAVLIYADEDQREDSLKRAEALKKRGLSVTDFRILSSTCLPEKKTGDVIAEFDYYIMPSNRIKTISNRQEWVYLESSKSWKNKSRLPLFE